MGKFLGFGYYPCSKLPDLSKIFCLGYQIIAHIGVQKKLLVGGQQLGAKFWPPGRDVDSVWIAKCSPEQRQ
jgi:hypothetical protein